MSKTVLGELKFILTCDKRVLKEFQRLQTQAEKKGSSFPDSIVKDMGDKISELERAVTILKSNGFK